MHLRSPKNRAAHPTWRAPVLAGVLAVITMAATACGSSPGAPVANVGSHQATTTTTPGPGAGGGSGGNGLNTGGATGPGGGGQSTVGMGGVTVQFAQCMRSHGEPDFPDPNGQGQVSMSGVNPRSPSFQAAQRACAKYAPNGGKPPSAAQTKKALDQALRYTQCMRNHGIKDYPDPQAGPGGGISMSIHASAGSDLDPNNPLFEAAQKACQPLARGQLGAP